VLNLLSETQMQVQLVVVGLRFQFNPFRPG